MKKFWFSDTFIGKYASAARSEMLKFANDHELGPGEIIVLSERELVNTVCLAIAYYAPEMYKRN